MPNTFKDNFGNEYMNPFIPQKVVGFTGIDPDIVPTGSGCTCSPDLSDEQRAQVNQMLIDYLTNLTIKIDSGDVNDPIPPMPYVVLRPDEIPHNALNGLQGGQSGEYYHLTEEELQRLQALIAATFPSGSGPVFPSGPSDPDDPSGGGDDPDLDPFGGLPPTMLIDWTGNSMPGKDAGLPIKMETYKDAGRMYYGTIAYKNGSPYIMDALVVPVRKEGSTTGTYQIYTQDLETWEKWESSQKTISSFGKTYGDWICVNFTKSNATTSSGKNQYCNLLAMSAGSGKNIPHRSHSGWGTTATEQKEFVACCYSPQLKKVLFVTKDGYVERVYDGGSANKATLKASKETSNNCGIAPNMACAAWSPEQQIYCVTGPDGVTISSTGDAGTWTVQSSAPKDLHDLEYRTDIDGGAFIAWSGVDRHFYVSRDGKTWVNYSTKAIPLTTVKQVAYSPACGWYCAVGASNKAYFSKTLTNWVETNIASSSINIGSVIWMPSTNKFIALPDTDGGSVFYTYEVN